jgi:hypothetical protein
MGLSSLLEDDDESAGQGQSRANALSHLPALRLEVEDRGTTSGAVE